MTTTPPRYFGAHIAGYRAVGAAPAVTLRNQDGYLRATRMGCPSAGFRCPLPLGPLPSAAAFEEKPATIAVLVEGKTAVRPTSTLAWTDIFGESLQGLQGVREGVCWASWLSLACPLGSSTWPVRGTGEDAGSAVCLPVPLPVAHPPAGPRWYWRARSTAVAPDAAAGHQLSVAAGGRPGRRETPGRG